EPAGRLVRCPAGDERRRSQSCEDEPELEEHELEEPSDTADVDAWEEVRKQAAEVWRLAELLDERRSGASQDQAEEADPDPPGDGRRQAVPDRPGGRPAQPDEGPGQAGRRDRPRRADVAAGKCLHADGL